MLNHLFFKNKIFSVLNERNASKSIRFVLQNRNKNAPNDISTTHYTNSTVQSQNASLLPWKNVSQPSTNTNSSSYSRLGNQHSNDEQYVDGNSDSGVVCSSASASMIYRTSISDLGSSSSSTAIAQLTNTRIKSITNRRGAVKYQKYVYSMNMCRSLKQMRSSNTCASVPFSFPLLY